MGTPLRRRLRLARRGATYTVAITLVLVATLLGAASQVLPLAERYPEQVAEWLGQRAGRAVAFDRVETRWTRRGPLLQLDNLRVGEGAQAFTIGDAEMLVSIYAGLLPGQAFSELRLRGLDLTLERAGDGRWQVRGLPGQQQAAGDPLEALEGLGELQVIDGKLAVVAPSLGIDAQIPRIDLRLRVDGDRVRAGMRAWPDAAVGGRGAASVDAMLDFDRGRGDGRAYAGTDRADLADWSALLQLMGIAVERGRGRAEAWAQLREHRIAMVTVDTALEQVVLRGAPLAPRLLPPRTRFGQVQARARWRLADGGWRLDVPTLRIGGGDQTRSFDGLALVGGERYGLLAPRLDAATLLKVAALSDRLPPALRRWLQAAEPVAALHAVEIVGRRGGPVHASARIEGLGFEPVGDAPGVHGLGGQFDGDSDGFVLQLDPATPLRVDWPVGFESVQVATLRGAISGWREEGRWRIGTPALRIAGDGFGADLRGALRWQGDGSRPWLDLAMVVDETSLPVAKRFWIRHVMPPNLIDWLDSALVAGTVRNGRALVSGDLDAWPFDDDSGRFEASARIADATLSYQPGWPVAEGVDVDARFIADGLTVDGSGSVAGVRIPRLHADVDHYGDGRLVVRAHGAGDAAQLLDLLRQSPLQPRHADTLANLSASGRAAVEFDFALPLHRGSAAMLGGEVVLDNATLADRRWKLRFDQVGGRIEYGRNGFRADALRARHDGSPGRLALRAGDDYVRDRGNLFEAGLDATLAADDVLDRAPDLGWLKPYLDGRSAWTVGITIPKASRGRNPPARLQLRSSLVGTELTLPAPLRKPVGTELATTIDAPLPLGSGEVRVGLGNLMGLRARSSGPGQTGVRIVLGSSEVDQPPPTSGLAATGRAGTLDALAWIALTRDGPSGGGERLPLHGIDVTAQQLQLLGGSFPDTHLVVAPAADGAIAVRAEGASLDGALVVPTGEGAVSGRFERVHWRSAEAMAAGPAIAATAGDAILEEAAATPGPAVATAALPTAVAAEDELDPAGIPPLMFQIDDLRIADARLGTATIRTRPTATGLRVEQLQTRDAHHAIDLTGDWTGRGATARTQVAAQLDSEDFGALLNGLGMGGQLAGGAGELDFDAGWQGSPADFALAGISGSLTVSARNGRLLEVEPGAGRVLGLLSLAELPRRLALDFRDFFNKGFAFNRMGGVVQFAGGEARSDDLLIDGPAAAISIRGAANLHTQSFDQTIEVRPKSGNLLTAVGAIAGGPVGAAIGAAANAVLQKPLGQISTRVYRVTGPWTEPKVEVLSREQSRYSAAQAPPAG